MITGVRYNLQPIQNAFDAMEEFAQNEAIPVAMQTLKTNLLGKTANGLDAFNQPLGGYKSKTHLEKRQKANLETRFKNLRFTNAMMNSMGPGSGDNSNILTVDDDHQTIADGLIHVQGSNFLDVGQDAIPLMYRNVQEALLQRILGAR